MTKGSAIPALALLLGILTPFSVVAQDSAELLARMKAMEDRIKSLEAEVQTLKGDQAATQAALTAATPPSRSRLRQPLPRPPRRLKLPPLPRHQSV